MKTILYTIFAAGLGFFLISSSGGRASIGNQGNTGAPGDNSRTCITCHGSTIATDLSIEVLDGNEQAITEYTAGETYRVVVTIESNASRFGFQMTSLIDDTSEDVESWSDPSDNAKIANAQGRQYVEQDGLSSENVFEADWTAPADNVGSITFYAGGISANGNGNTSGDGGAVNSLTITPTTTSVLDQNIQDLILAQFANPVLNELYFSLDGNQSFDISIVNTSGQLMDSWKGVQGEFAADMSSLSSGLYFVNFRTESGQHTERIVKQ